MRFSRDYYRILGVPSTASPDEIKRAFRRLARQYHPDVNEAPDAEAHFKALNEAYQVLGDPAERAAYDRFRRSGGYTPPYPRQHSSHTARSYSYTQTRSRASPPRRTATQTRSSASPPRRTARGLGDPWPARIDILQGLVIIIIGAATVSIMGQVPDEVGQWVYITGLLLVGFVATIRHFWQNYRAERSRTQNGRTPYNWVFGVLGMISVGSYFLQPPPRDPVLLILGLTLVDLGFLISPV